MDFLQLLLGQDKAVDLFLTSGAREGNTTHKHRPTLFLFLSLRGEEKRFITQSRAKGKKCFALHLLGGCTLTKDDNGNVAKSEEALAPGWVETTCSATSP